MVWYGMVWYGIVGNGIKETRRSSPAGAPGLGLGKFHPFVEREKLNMLTYFFTK